MLKHKELSRERWINDDICKAQFEQIRQRCDAISILVNNQNIEHDAFIEICCEITVSIHDAVDEIEDSTSKKKYEEILASWYNVFYRIGYTEKHPTFRKPEKNLMAVEAFEKNSMHQKQ